MICDLKITSGYEKNCVKISWWTDIPLKSYHRKTVLRGHEIHSKMMIFSNNNFDVSILKIRDEQLEYVDKIKFLGVIVDRKVRLYHIKGECSKVARVCGIFNILLFSVFTNYAASWNFIGLWNWNKTQHLLTLQHKTLFIIPIRLDSEIFIISIYLAFIHPALIALFFYNSIKFWNELPLCVKNVLNFGKNIIYWGRHPVGESVRCADGGLGGRLFRVKASGAVLWVLWSYKAL